MALDKEIAQDLIDDFVLSNDVELNTISTQNPVLFDATLNALNFLSARFGTGQKMQIVEKPKVVQEVVQGGLPFKDGDKFKVPEEKNEQTYTLKDIRLEDDQVMISWYSLSDKVDKSYLDSIKDVTKRLNEGNWVLVGATQFKLGQIIWDKQQSELVIIGSKTNDTLELVSYRQKRNKSVDTLDEDIKLGASILLKFKVGDNFIDNDGYKYEIYGLVSNSATNVMVLKNGKHTSLLWEYIDNKIIYGEWTLSMPTTPQVTNNPNDIKIGDLIVKSFDNTIWEILDVKQNEVKLMTSNNKKETGSLGILNEKIDKGENIKLAFGIGDTFVNPEGDLYKIMELYPNNEKSLWVKVNEKPNLEVFQWDLIEDWVVDGYWVTGTKADAEIIKANLSATTLTKSTSGAKNNKQFAQNQPKAPKKRMTKLEKEIKDLQEEIDGLLFLADEDDEAKAELEKKQIQIEALKTKKP
jgi:hypothetical protein